MIRRWQYVILSALTLFFLSPSFGQRSISFDQADKYYQSGLELFDKEKYGAAQEMFRQAMASYGDQESEVRSDAEYYAALCAIKLFNDDAEYLTTRYLLNNPESPKVNNIRLQMANYLFQTKQYRKASGWYDGIDRTRLDQEQRAEYFFKKGYCCFQRNDYDDASLTFYEIKDRDTYYTSPAIYYYAHIAYQQKNYETALREFMRLKEDENFGAIVPYYILQIYYLQKKYDEIITQGPALLENATPSREPEIAKFIGDALFRRDRFGESIPYLEKYMEKVPVLIPEDQFELGYAYYRTGKFDKAASLFEKVAGRKSITGQQASYHLADCYLRLGDKNGARLAFSAASSLDYDPAVKEDALFNFAKITYELAYSPFNEAIRAFNEYIQKYPGSDKIDDVYNYLGMAFMNTRNYKMAMQSLDKILVRNDQIKRAYQRVAFYRGLELYKNLEFDNAIDHFDLSLQYKNYDPQIEARAYYWKAEALYRQGAYEEAIRLYNLFLTTPGAYLQYEYPMAHYDLGYTYFNKKEYSQAMSWFRKYISLSKVSKSNLLADAYNRIGDCQFVSSDYEQAVESYNKAIDAAISNADYALYQKGFSLGLLKKNQEKIAVLQDLITRFPNSSYCDDAIFEIGHSYVLLQQHARAIETYQRILTDYPKGGYIAKSMVQMGLVYYDQDQYQQAIKWFKDVISQYPGTTEAKNAITGLKNVYVDMNDVDSYFAYIQGLGTAVDVRKSEQDSLTYINGENLYMAGNCERALQVFANYLQQFPQGNFTLNAHFYLAECLEKQGNHDEAMKSYQVVISSPRNLFTEPALLSVARVQFDNKNYLDALENYLILDQVAERPVNQFMARVGQLRCYYLLDRPQRVKEVATVLLRTENLDGALAREARYKMAKACYSMQQYDEALEHFRILAREVSSAEGAEAKYRVAEILYLAGKKNEAETEINSLIDMNTPQQYWMAKAFLLLGDVLVAKNDLFQARYTIQSLIDGYGVTTDGILDEAQKKLQDIIKLEQQRNPQSDTLPAVKFSEIK
jgi:TolA-binding protein